MTRLNRRIGAWIAIFAMTLNAVWPVLAQAKPGPSPMLLEVCTSAGVQKIVVGGDQPADQSSSGKMSPHCAFCSLGTDQVVIPAAARSGIAQVVRVRESLPVVSQAPPREPFVLSPAQPRAPPSLS